MKLLLDTHVLLWAAEGKIGPAGGLSPEASALLADPANDLYFSAASIWEVAIKASLARPDFHADPRLLRRGLLDNGYTHLPVAAEHAVAVSSLPNRHKDPFDRILIAQAITEGITLITADPVVASYPGPIRLL